jgi:hypothetical protein
MLPHHVQRRALPGHIQHREGAQEHQIPLLRTQYGSTTGSEHRTTGSEHRTTVRQVQNIVRQVQSTVRWGQEHRTTGSGKHPLKEIEQAYGINTIVDIHD